MVNLSATIPAVSLEETKRWLRVEIPEEDEIIRTLILSSTQMVETRIRRAIISRGQEAGIAESIETVPGAIKTVILALVAYQYENRSATDDELRARVLRAVGLDGFIDWGVMQLPKIGELNRRVKLVSVSHEPDDSSGLRKSASCWLRSGQSARSLAARPTGRR